jgi:hypothetical protein
MDFSRPLLPVEAEGWEDMLGMLREVRLDSSPDKTHWLLEKSGKYTTKSLYRFLLHRGVVNKRMRKLWKNRLPMKVRVFM